MMFPVLFNRAFTSSIASKTSFIFFWQRNPNHCERSFLNDVSDAKALLAEVEGGNLMPTTVAAQLAAQAVLLEHISSRMEEDRQERKTAQAETERTRAATSAELIAMRHGQNDVLRRLNNIEPVTDLVTSLKAKAIGALMLLGFIGGIMWGGIVFFKEIIVEWLK